MTTLTLHVARHRRPFWRRAGFWQCAALLLALAPFAGLLWESLSPPAPLPAAPQAVAPAPLALKPLGRVGAPESAELAAISDDNLFTPSRADWALAVAPEKDNADAEAEHKRREERRKQAETELEKMTFVATIRNADEWRALVDHAERKPGDDLLSLREGDDFKSWKVEAISRDSMTLSFEGDRRVTPLRPRVPSGKPALGPQLGRSMVQVREPKDGVVVDPPISHEEARRRLLQSVEPGDERLRRLVDELLESMDKPNRAPAPPPAPPAAPPEKRS